MLQNGPRLWAKNKEPFKDSCKGSWGYFKGVRGSLGVDLRQVDSCCYHQGTELEPACMLQGTK